MSATEDLGPATDVALREQAGSRSTASPDSRFDDDAHESDRIDHFLSPLAVPDETLYRLSCRLANIYLDLGKTSQVQFLPTPLATLPCGKEKGTYLAINVGGSNLRVAFIHLLGDNDSNESRTSSPLASGWGKDTATHTPRQASTGRSRDFMGRPSRPRLTRSYEKTWPIGDHLKKDKEGDLFLWIGDCMAEVVADSLGSTVAKGEPIPEEIEVGITFSFPMMQDTLSEATLMPTGKGFAIASNLNLGETLLAGYERHTRKTYEGMHCEPSAKRRRRFSLPRIKIAAIANDTVATLASLAYVIKALPNSRVGMGIIVGTGSNATLPMRLEDLAPNKTRAIRERNPQASKIIVNTEWTMGGSAAPLTELNLITRWDSMLDRECPRPGFQPFEYMTGGRYIGELIRIILYDYLTSFTNATHAALPGNLVQPYALSTMFVSTTIAQSPTDERLLENLRRSLPPPEFSEWYWTLNSAAAFRKIARAVQNRSAGLIAAAVVALLACQGELCLGQSATPQTSDLASPGPATSRLVLPILGNSSTLTSVSTPSLAANTPDTDLVPDISRTSSPGAKSDNHALAASTAPASWNAGPEEIVVAYTGGIIQHYPRFKETCQRYIDRLIMWNGPQESGKSVFLREASDGGIIGAGVLAGMVACHQGLAQQAAV
ncbi:hypothetical protein KEM52_002332 [Ascosphaera acerosa]|nr:hypothetical protein KEM52_002332 [Ascosphaera acerosa]